MNIFEDLKYRGLIYQTTDENELSKRLEQGPIILYCGFDPTADSLHLGNFQQILILKRFQKAGHTPIAVAGGGTGMIGDPSGKSEERVLQTEKDIAHNLKKVSKQLENLLPGVKVVNNLDWLGKMDVIEYLRDIGKHFSVNSMLSKDSVKTRLERGISFTEFNYMVLQATDFLKLYKDYNCELQIGGSDQWGNITAGTDLIRKLENKPAFALTSPLMTKADGGKFGKTESGTIWLDAEKTSPYEFYQFWINSADSDVIKFIKAFTFLDKDEIEKLKQEVENKPETREAQKTLAFLVTELVHGKKIAEKMKETSEAWFNKAIKDFTEQEIETSLENVPSFDVKGKEINLIDLLIQAEIESSKRQAREDITNGAISLNGEKCVDTEKKINQIDFLFKKYLVIKKGKKNYFLIKW